MVCELQHYTPTLRYTLCDTHNHAPTPSREIGDTQTHTFLKLRQITCGDGRHSHCTKIQKTTMTWKTRKAARKILKTTKARLNKNVKAYMLLGGIAISIAAVAIMTSDIRGQSRLNSALAEVQRGRRLDHNGAVVCSDVTKEGYITELFDCNAKKNGAVVLYILGVLYMFVGLSIVCDEFFVPALEGFVEAFSISDDVAGATFMAAGGSAPELFTSFMGVFVAKSSVGFGTIVGSAVFNVLFVIGMCAMFSKDILVLTWWPLFRDCTYYAFSLGILAYFFGGTQTERGPNHIEWWEALLLLVMYAGYVILMKYNENLHKVIDKWLAKGKTQPSDMEEKKVEIKDDHPFRRRTKDKRKSGVNVLARPTKFRAGILQHVFNNDSKSVVKRARSFVVQELIGDVHETFQQIDKNGDEKIDRGELTTLLKELTGSEPLKEDVDEALADMQLDDTGEVTKDEFIKWYNDSEISILKNVKDAYNNIDTDNDGRIDSNELGQVLSSISQNGDMSEDEVKEEVKRIMDRFGKKVEGDDAKTLPFEAFHDWYVNSDLYEAEVKAQEKRKAEPTESKSEEEDGEDSEPLDISFPKDLQGRIVYILCFPLMITLYFTVPDVRNEKWKNWYPFSFVASIVWIGLYSYFMVWWAEVIGVTFGIPDTVMGLTFLAAGTSIPDLLSSVIVARQGLGDMAVSSSVGSNIFDILMGLPIPWFFYSLTHNMEPMVVGADGLFISVLILLVMLIAVVATIAICKWQMTKTLGLIMFLLYVIFVAQDLMREFHVIG